MIKQNRDLEYFKFIRQEILDRIGVHYRTLVTKFILVGALLGFLLAHTDKIDLSAFLIASIFSCLFDILLLENLGWIKSAGKYVKEKIENESFSIRWEHDFAHYGGRWHCFNPWSYLAGVWSIGLFLFIGFFVLDHNSLSFTHFNGNDYLMLLSLILLGYTLWLTFLKLK